MQPDNLASIDSTTKAGKKKSTKLDQMNQRLNRQDRTTANELKAVLDYILAFPYILDTQLDSRIAPVIVLDDAVAYVHRIAVTDMLE